MPEEGISIVTWWLYLLACEDGRTYAGIALDVDARFKAHVSGKGAKFTRANRPVKILGAQSFATRSAASKAEYALKSLKPAAKLQWARQWPHGEDPSSRARSEVPPLPAAR